MRFMTAVKVVGYLGVCLTGTNVMLADTIGTSTLTTFGWATDLPFGGTSVCDVMGSSCIGSATVPGTNLTVAYDSEASATFAVLKGYGNLVISNAPKTTAFSNSSSPTAQTEATFSDSFAVEAPGESGAGFLEFNWAVTGNIFGSPNTGDFGEMLLRIFNSDTNALIWRSSSYGNCFNCVSFSSPTMVTAVVPITFGLADDLRMEFNTLTGIGGTVAGQDSQALADFSHTAEVTGIQVLDANQNPVSDFSITSGSGTNYNPNSVVPEPSSLFLFASALLIILGRPIATFFASKRLRYGFQR